MKWNKEKPLTYKGNLKFIRRLKIWGFVLLPTSFILYSVAGTAWVKGYDMWYTTYSEELTIWGYLALIGMCAAFIMIVAGFAAGSRIKRGLECPECHSIAAPQSFSCPTCHYRFDGRGKVHVFQSGPDSGETQLRFCAHCGKRIESSVVYCPYCGYSEFQKGESVNG